MAARCETVLNTTMAEMDTYHTQKVEDFQALTKDHLDGEIALYEQVGHRCMLPPLHSQIIRRSWFGCATRGRHSTTRRTRH